MEVNVDLLFLEEKVILCIHHRINHQMQSQSRCIELSCLGPD